MAKILRKAYKIFGSSAPAAAGGLEQFGGLAAGAVNYTVDVETLQALTAWADGWSAACLGTNSPVLEERNAVDHVHGYQIGYLLQQGIPEWLSTQTYYKNNYVVDSNGKLRVSVIDNNIGNDPILDNGGQYWGFGGGSGSGKSIGEVFWSQSSSASDNAGSLPLFTGETISSADTLYPDFYAWVNSHAELQISDADYETALSVYGECPKYVINTINKTIRLPKLVNYIKNANTTDGITQKLAGLPNITGTDPLNWQNQGWLITNGPGATGAFTAQKQVINGGAKTGSGTSGNEPRGVAFDASLSNPIYGSSNTVRPPHTTLYPWVCAYNASIPASTDQAAEFQNALTGKADVGLGNLTDAGKIVSAHLSMPSGTYDLLTLGASGSTYTAPADGYFMLYAEYGSGTGVFFDAFLASCGYIGFRHYFSSSSSAGRCFVPAKKGDVLSLYYSGTLANTEFRFVYAEGSKSEQ